MHSFLRSAFFVAKYWFFKIVEWYNYPTRVVLRRIVANVTNRQCHLQQTTLFFFIWVLHLKV